MHAHSHIRLCVGVCARENASVCLSACLRGCGTESFIFFVGWNSETRRRQAPGVAAGAQPRGGEAPQRLAPEDRRKRNKSRHRGSAGFVVRFFLLAKTRLGLHYLFDQPFNLKGLVSFRRAKVTVLETAALLILGIGEAAYSCKGDALLHLDGYSRL